ncbi:MAG: SRPBCC domain-containing protein [Deltaproteobacteria bacterium]|nr:SRPBCC domain-containing protein [Deltaproteobacteria bacterium]
MPDILHELSINAPIDRVFAAIGSREGLSDWWTTTTSGDSAPGQTLTFTFGTHSIDMRVDALEKPGHIAWQCTREGPEWLGTKITFDLSPKEGRTLLRFGHRGWAETGRSFAHCNMRWAMFLLSLRELVETGKGRPFPYALPI